MMHFRADVSVNQVNTMRIQVHPWEILALKQIMHHAIENSCTCITESAERSGYLGHNTGCWVHFMREDLQEAQDLIDRFERGNLG